MVSSRILEGMAHALVFSLLYGILIRSVSTMSANGISRWMNMTVPYGALFGLVFNFAVLTHTAVIFERTATWLLGCACVYLGSLIGAAIDRKFQTVAHARGLRAAVRGWFPRKP